METDLREDLYQEYRMRMLEIEDKKEEYQRRKRSVEQEKEESREYFRQENTVLEHLNEMWGECEDIGRTRCEVGDFIDEEQQKLYQVDEELDGEYQDICRLECTYEELYKEAQWKLTEEEEARQE